MNTCKTCKYWTLPDQADRELNVFIGDDLAHLVADEPGDLELRNRVEEESRKRHGYNVRQCTSPKVVFYEHPDKDGAVVIDGSQYKASLGTAEDFGCVHHESSASALELRAYFPDLSPVRLNLACLNVSLLSWDKQQESISFPLDKALLYFPDFDGDTFHVKVHWIAPRDYIVQEVSLTLEGYPLLLHRNRRVVDTLPTLSRGSTLTVRADMPGSI